MEDFTFENCRNFLDSNPSGEQADMVRAGLNQILQEQRGQRILIEEYRKNRISDLERNSVKWMDFNQFMEKKKYNTHRNLSLISFIGLLLCLFVMATALYYTNNEFYMYSNYDFVQEEKTSGLESLLLKMDVIELSNWWGSDYEPGYDEYRLDSSFFCFSMFGIASLFLFIISLLTSSPIIRSVYNIEDSTEKTKFRAAQNQAGKVGLLKVGKFRLSAALPMKYDNIYPVGAAYVVKENDKYGLFSVELKKLVVPVEYESITYYDNDTITLSKNGIDQTFSYKGYRLFR